MFGWLLIATQSCHIYRTDLTKISNIDSLHPGLTHTLLFIQENSKNLGRFKQTTIPQTAKPNFSNVYQ